VAAAISRCDGEAVAAGGAHAGCRGCPAPDISREMAGYAVYVSAIDVLILRDAISEPAFI
jgi:hypothetical protein